MITISKKDDDCRPCKKGKKGSEKEKQVGILTTALLVLLPKCPFCVMAFSSTIILCGTAGGVTEQTHSYLSTAIIVISSFLCLSVLLSIAFNYRDARTKYALILAVVGCFLVIYSVCIGGGKSVYFSGLFLIFIGVWLNASLLYIIGKITGRRKIIQE